MGIKDLVLNHNKRCSKSRACLQILQNKGIHFKECNYTREGISKKDFKNNTKNLVNPISELIRVNHKDFKLNTFDLSNKDQIIKFLNKYLECIERLIFFNGIKYIIFRPPEKILSYL